MCKKERNYDKVRIEVCRNCHGAGKAAPKLPPPEAAGRVCEPERCPVCGGSGRVRKTVKIEITVEPYEASDK